MAKTPQPKEYLLPAFEVTSSGPKPAEPVPTEQTPTRPTKSFWTEDQLRKTLELTYALLICLFVVLPFFVIVGGITGYMIPSSSVGCGLSVILLICYWRSAD